MKRHCFSNKGNCPYLWEIVDHNGEYDCGCNCGLVHHHEDLEGCSFSTKTLDILKGWCEMHQHMDYDQPYAEWSDLDALSMWSDEAKDVVKRPDVTQEAYDRAKERLEDAIDKYVAKHNEMVKRWCAEHDPKGIARGYLDKDGRAYRRQHWYLYGDEKPKEDKG